MSKSNKAGLTNAELELTQRIQTHFPRGLDPEVIAAWNSCQKEILEQRLAEVFGLLHQEQKSQKQEPIVTSPEFYLLLSDEEAVAWMVKHAEKSEEEAKQAISALRKKARAYGIADDVALHAEVRPGCAFKRDIPKLGPCRDNFQYLQNWTFPDPLTEHCLLSWIPAPLKGSTEKNIFKQKELVSSFKTEAELPSWYEFSFGLLNHVAGLAFAHFKATGKDPFANLIVRTDTCDADGYRLELDWSEGSLDCGRWHWGGDSNPDIAVFAVGVVKTIGH